ncbi:MAG: CPBP family intramembrane metalloprotease [Candidatus Nitrosopelagicus sp.]|nr:CPBP family intramembrane metalloprotease [Candidatus Nitrosopelagicus sp.]
MTFLANVLQTIGIPYSALISIIFGLMIVSFPIGAYVVFNSEIGDNIDFGFPLEKFDLFIAGINMEIPFEYQIGDAFVVVWCVFAVLFTIAIIGPKKSFLGSISGLLIREKNLTDANYLITIIKWFSVLVVISGVINFVQESFGIVTEPPESTNDLILFLAVTIAPIIEEIGFRVILIGIPLFLIYSFKTSIRSFFHVLWHPYENLHIVDNKKAILLIVLVGIFFGAAHIISGEPWSSGKFAQAAVSGIIIGWVYYRYGLIAAILIHWATNYFIFSYVFAISEINGISIESAITHTMVNTLEIILVVTGIVSISIIIMNYLNSKNQNEVNKAEML